MLGWLMAVACGPGGPGAAEEAPSAELSFFDQVLPDARLAESYRQALTWSGGEGPYAWRVTGGALPVGLRLTSEGKIAGTPSEAGSFEATVSVTDGVGRTRLARVGLNVRYDVPTFSCGDTIGGQFDNAGWSTEGGPDWSAEGSYAWMDLALPPPEVTRVEVQFKTTLGLTVFLAEPNAPLGSVDYDDHYRSYAVGTDGRLVIDLATDPNLAAYIDQGRIPMILVSNGAQSWDLEVVCSDGPIFQYLWTLPTELGQEFTTDWDVAGSQEGVRIWTDDPLPPWVELAEDGRLLGTAQEPGGWEFDIQAEDRFGRRRTERTHFGVFEVQPIGCGDQIPVTTEEGMYEGDFTGPYDPKGFKVYSLAWSEAYSAVDLELEGTDDTFVGLAMPEPYYRFYANAAYDVAYGAPALVTLGTRTYPSWSNYAADGEVLVVAAPLGAATNPTLTVRCDPTPRTDLFGLPVLKEGVAEVFPLRGVGGQPAYLWESPDAPAGIALGSSLRTAGLPASRQEITLDIVDSAGQTSQDRFTLYVSESEACAGFEPLPCDAPLDGVWTTPAYADAPYSAASSRTFCFVPRPEDTGYFFSLQLGAETSGYIVLADPGRTADDLLFAGAQAVRFWGDEGDVLDLALGQEGWPKLPDYQDLPVILRIEAYEEGPWSFHVSCF